MFNFNSNYFKSIILMFVSIIYSQDVTYSFGADAVDDSTGTITPYFSNGEADGGTTMAGGFV